MSIVTTLIVPATLRDTCAQLCAALAGPAGDGVAEATYRKIEAETMQRGYSGLFRDVDVETEMAKRRKDAAEWVLDNKDRLI